MAVEQHDGAKLFFKMWAVIKRRNAENKTLQILRTRISWISTENNTPDHKYKTMFYMNGDALFHRHSQ
jgi:hypothetical protein